MVKQSMVTDLMINSEKILICGLGASGAIAMDAFHKFLRLGLNVVIFTDNHLMNIGCAHANKKYNSSCHYSFW